MYSVFSTSGIERTICHLSFMPQIAFLSEQFVLQKLFYTEKTLLQITLQSASNASSCAHSIKRCKSTLKNYLLVFSHCRLHPYRNNSFYKNYYTQKNTPQRHCMHSSSNTNYHRQIGGAVTYCKFTTVLQIVFVSKRLTL